MKTQALAVAPVLAGHWHCRCGLGGLRHAAVKRGAEHGAISALSEPGCVICIAALIRSLCQRTAATQPCFMALTLAGGPVCHLNQLQGYRSMSPRCFYGNSLISPLEPCFLSPPWVSVSCRDSLHAGNPAEARCRRRRATRADVVSAPRISTGLFSTLNATMLARLKVFHLAR